MSILPFSAGHVPMFSQAEIWPARPCLRTQVKEQGAMPFYREIVWDHSQHRLCRLNTNHIGLAWAWEMDIIWNATVSSSFDKRTVCLVFVLCYKNGHTVWSWHEWARLYLKKCIFFVWKDLIPRSLLVDPVLENMRLRQQLALSYRSGTINFHLKQLFLLTPFTKISNHLYLCLYFMSDGHTV